MNLKKSAESLKVSASHHENPVHPVLPCTAASEARVQKTDTHRQHFRQELEDVTR